MIKITISATAYAALAEALHFESVAVEPERAWDGSVEIWLAPKVVAKFLIRLASEDESLDATTLRDGAVAALGGVAYSAIPAIHQTSNASPAK